MNRLPRFFYILKYELINWTFLALVCLIMLVSLGSMQNELALNIKIQIPYFLAIPFQLDIAMSLFLIIFTYPSITYVLKMIHNRQFSVILQRSGSIYFSFELLMKSIFSSYMIAWIASLGLIMILHYFFKIPLFDSNFDSMNSHHLGTFNSAHLYPENTGLYYLLIVHNFSLRATFYTLIAVTLAWIIPNRSMAYLYGPCLFVLLNFNVPVNSFWSLLHPTSIFASSRAFDELMKYLHLGSNDFLHYLVQLAVFVFYFIICWIIVLLSVKENIQWMESDRF